ncbi:MAG: tRNA (N(6)-L-threonylcarbamoyladenosine(37)-C(2))-methylthiotransferase [Nitrososphaerales archaeon]
MPRIFIEGHGCSASFADTEILSGLISQGGYVIVEDDKDADLSVLVTCSVKDVTEKRMLSRIQELSNGGRSKVVIAGCLSKTEPEKIHRINPNLSLLGPGNLDQILPVIESTLRGEKRVETSQNKLVKLGMPRSRKNNLVGIVEISSGCLSSCTFCQVKLVKGVVFSYPEDEILKEVRNLISMGVREIWLTSTDNAAYGRDSKSSLPTLIRRVSALPGEFKVRVGMMNPLLTGKILDDLIECYLDPKVFKFLHLPVQSGSDRILKSMQRGYSIDDFLETVSTFRNAIPNLTLSTDIIVGFPSEIESDFRLSADLVRKVSPDIVNLSRFGARSGTKAALMADQLSSSVLKNRSIEMTEVIREISLERNLKWIGWKGNVLVDEEVKGAFVGRNYAYKPCLIKNVEGTDTFLGDNTNVTVEGATSLTLRCRHA